MKRRVYDVTSDEICNRDVLILRQNHEVLLPYPAESVARIILVLGEPEFAFLGDDVEDLALHVG